MSDTHQSDEAILAATRHLSDDERTAYLETTCGNDPRRRRRMEALLQSSNSSDQSDSSHKTTTGPSGTVVADDEATVSDTVPLPSEETLGDTIGRYKLLERIGEGGFGLVYVAEQTEPIQRQVALKIIKLGMDTRQVVARFEAERQTLALMDHPNIAKVLDGGATNTGRPYFVMELVRGVKITEHCDRNKLSMARRLDLFMQVCRAIEHAHQKGIIHRDIKPSNILITMQDGAPVPKVIDFGIAKATQGHLAGRTMFTQFDQFVGTPAYMSPEQAEGSGIDIDTRSDIYSLGVLLYELLTGETPLESKNLLARGFDEMRRLIREWEPQKPSIRLHKLDAKNQTTTATRHGTDTPKLIKMVEGDLDWVVMKCLEKDRSRRYASAAQIISEIQRYLDDEPVAARPPSNWYRFQKMVRRNRLAFAAGSVILISLIAALFVTTWFVVKEKQARDAAERALQDSDRARHIGLAEELKAQAAQREAAEAQRRSEVSRLQAQAALEEARAERNKARVAAEQAEAARKTAERAVQQSHDDLAKADAAEKDALNARSEAQAALQLAKTADARESAEAAKLEQAIKNAATESSLRLAAETALRQEAAARRQAEAAAAASLAQASFLRQNITNFLNRLDSLAPRAALAAASAFFVADDPQLYSHRAEWRARQGDWTNAMADFSKASKLDGAGSQLKDSVALLAAQTSGATIFPVVWQGRDRDELTSGLASLRKNDNAEAIQHFNKALAACAADPAGQAEICAALAIAQQKLNQLENAHANLQSCQQLIAAKLPKLDSGDLGANWREWIMANALSREAAALLVTKAPAAPAK